MRFSALAVAVSVSIATAITTTVRCPYGHGLIDKPGPWIVNVVAIPDRYASAGRGDVLKCRCAKCRGVWYELIAYHG